jgi:hypothetical protein
MLELRPTSEYCDTALPPASTGARDLATHRCLVASAGCAFAAER